ncbi:MAG: M23 family metallopeptidase [Acidobacteria bacterium]|nr:M23 family metallopeptidase [Acidobacteriota bacterium]
MIKTDRQKIFWLWVLIFGALLLVAGIWRVWLWLQPRAAFPTQVQPSVTPAPTVSAPNKAAEEPATQPIAEAVLPAGLKLIIPVEGIKPDQLRDTFNDARSAGRTHNAIDIMAARGTPVLAAADGEVVRLFNSEAGGTTLYQLNQARNVVFYYAHLERYADSLFVGRQVKQGEVIAYVGDTGNAGAGNYHLHFGVWLTDDPKRFWDGTNVNPYELFKRR